jgi:mono/diheme cytochrome c family protein
LFLLGCRQTNTEEFRFNSAELLKQERLTLATGQTYPVQQRKEIQLILRALFGTPDHPRLPDLPVLRTIYSGSGQEPSTKAGPKMFQLANLAIAAGSVRSDEAGKSFGLYREHCANCHGLAGDGAGATAGFLNPYPRDFRLGKFKFKSTPLRKAPTHNDMLALLKNGIPGTAMPSFRRLHEAELEALIDYVRYLSVRGQVERYLISALAQLDQETFLSGNDLTNENWTGSQLDQISAQAIKLFGEAELSSFVTRWLDAQQDVTAVPTPPTALNPDDSQYSALVESGRELYFGKKANCAECHGQTAAGNATPYFDDWTGDWVKSAGIDLTNRNSYRDFLKAGALPPRTVRPRNLLLGIMRGGSDIESIYRRIANGIEGTPMPSSAATLKEDEIWALVAYVRSLGNNHGQAP